MNSLIHQWNKNLNRLWEAEEEDHKKGFKGNILSLVPFCYSILLPGWDEVSSCLTTPLHCGALPDHALPLCALPDKAHLAQEQHRWLARVHNL